MKKCMLSVFALLILASVVYAQENTPVAVSGFNHDVVATGTGFAVSSTTSSFDHSGLENNHVFYVEGFGSGEYGLPADGKIISDANPKNTYQLAAYDDSNSLLISGTGSGSLYLKQPSKFSSIFFLAASSHGHSLVSVTLNYTDGTSDEVLTGVSLPDWFHDEPNVAIQGLGRVKRHDNNFDDRYPDPKLFEFEISGIDPDLVLESITFDKAATSSAAKAGIFAVSGKKIPPPIPLSGFIIPLVLLLMISFLSIVYHKVRF